MANAMLFVRPDSWWSRGATVTGTIDTDYELQWLVDGRIGYPIRAAGGSPASDLSLTLSGPSGDVNVAVLGNHNLIVPAVLTGDITVSLTPATTRPPNGIQLNPWSLVTGGTGITSVNLDVTGNDIAAVIGELVIGQALELTPVKIDGNTFDTEDFARPQAGEFLSVTPYDMRLEGRRLVGSQYYNKATVDLIAAWQQAQQAGTWPSIIIPDPAVNDAWFVKYMKFTYQQVTPKTADIYLVTFEFIEYPRSRW